MRFLTVLLPVVFLCLTTCAPAPAKDAVVRLTEDLVGFYNATLPPELPGYPDGETGPSVYLAGEPGRRSYLFRPAADIVRSEFPRDTLHTSDLFTYLTFYDEPREDERYSGTASEYEPADSSRFGSSVRVLEMATPAVYHQDNPNESALGYLSVFAHELAHTTVDFPEPDRIPRMLEQMMVFERNTNLINEITSENNLLLAALAADSDTLRNEKITAYLARKDQRTAAMLPLDVVAENYYELSEGYGRYVEHLMQQNATPGRFVRLEKVFGPLPAYNLADRRWMYDIVGNAYFYTLGFNKYRILSDAGDFRFAASLRGESEEMLDDYLRKLVGVAPAE